MSKVLLIEPTIRPPGVRLLRDAVEVGFAPDGREETLIRHLATGEFSAVITRAEKMTRSVIEAARNLKVIGQQGVGVDNIDLNAATQSGVMVLNAPTANTVSVAEHTVMLILALFRRTIEADQAVRRGDYKERDQYLPSELNGKTVFVVGFGRSGRETARRLRLGFNMRVLVYQRGPSAEKILAEGAEPVPLEEGFANADVVTLHIPHVPATTHFVSKALLNLMKPTAYLINTARGPVVDKAAVVDALKNGHIAGAGFDVFDPEPPAKDDPLTQLPNVIVSPHLAGDAIEARDRLSELIASQVLSAIGGNLPEHIVNREVVTARLRTKLVPTPAIRDSIRRPVRESNVA